MTTKKPTPTEATLGCNGCSDRLHIDRLPRRSAMARVERLGKVMREYGWTLMQFEDGFQGRDSKDMLFMCKNCTDHYVNNAPKKGRVIQ